MFNYLLNLVLFIVLKYDVFIITCNPVYLESYQNNNENSRFKSFDEKKHDTWNKENDYKRKPACLHYTKERVNCLARL